MNAGGSTQRIVLGMISGTSVDGIDAALCQLQGSGAATRYRLLRFETVDYAPELRSRIFRAFEPSATLDELCELNVSVGEAFAGAAKQTLANAGLEAGQVDLIGSHGQTVRHLPEGTPPSTLQIGDISVIAQLTGITTVGDFRTADMAVGGQGAPLVPLADYLLFKDDEKGRLLLNIGGISNVTVLPAGGSRPQVRAFDLGPGNMLMDTAAHHFSGGAEVFDRDGQAAARGEIDRVLLERLLEHEFLQRQPPKSTGREQFGVSYFAEISEEAGELAPEDMLATLTAFTAEAIIGGIHSFVGAVMHELWLGGGGAHNKTLVRHLTEGLPELRVESFSGLGIEPGAREALAFAVLANETIAGQTGNLPAATGAQRAVILGKIAPA